MRTERSRRRGSSRYRKRVSFVRKNWNLLCTIGFALISAPIFVIIYAKSKMIIDEEFHFDQGLQYCNLNFTKWNSKITTFPGLYLASIILHPFDMCDIFYLRLISLLAACINCLLFNKIRKVNLHRYGVNDFSVYALDSVALSILPPLYFFSHLYYTDVLSLTMVLLLFWYYSHYNMTAAAFFGIASILMRQTNIVWFGFVCGATVLYSLINTTVSLRSYYSRRRMNPDQVNVLTFKFWWEAYRTKGFCLEFFERMWRSCNIFVCVIALFVLFVVRNGSVALGDKNAHTLSMHLPQLFYFGAFTVFFALNNTINQFGNALKSIWRNKISNILLLIVILLTVKYNTVVHPYLLADNRHYTFYIWNKFYGRYNWFRYAMCPIYLISFHIIRLGINHLPNYELLLGLLAITVNLCLQKLLEVRYFLIPFVLFYLNTKPTLTTSKHRYVELCLYIVINMFTFYIFVNKELYWNEYAEPQRIIW